MKIIAKTAIVFEFFISILLNSVFSLLLGSIMVLQLVAHLPLANIYLPANLLQTFKVLTSMVSFDFFPLFEYIDMNFTETESWSTNFEWLGYDSVNFLEGLGIIAFFAAILLLKVVIWLMLKSCKRNCRPCKCSEKIFSDSAVWMSLLGFIHATFFEIVVSASISMSMLAFMEHLN